MSLNKEVMAAYQISSKSNEFTKKWVQEFLLSHMIVTLNGGQGHSRWYETTSIQCRGVYYTKFKEISLVNVWIQTSFYYLFWLIFLNKKSP